MFLCTSHPVWSDAPGREAEAQGGKQDGGERSGKPHAGRPGDFGQADPRSLHEELQHEQGESTAHTHRKDQQTGRGKNKAQDKSLRILFILLPYSVLCVTYQHPLLCLYQQPFIIHDMESFQLAEKTLAAHMVNSDYPEPKGDLQSGDVVPGVGCGELQQREAEARLFHCCQSTSVETVTELTEFAKAVPGFQSLDLNDQVSLGSCICHLSSCPFMREGTESMLFKIRNGIKS